MTLKFGAHALLTASFANRHCMERSRQFYEYIVHYVRMFQRVCHSHVWPQKSPPREITTKCCPSNDICVFLLQFLLFDHFFCRLCLFMFFCFWFFVLACYFAFVISVNTAGELGFPLHRTLFIQDRIDRLPCLLNVSHRTNGAADY